MSDREKKEMKKERKFRQRRLEGKEERERERVI